MRLFNEIRKIINSLPYELKRVTQYFLFSLIRRPFLLNFVTYRKQVNWLTCNEKSEYD